MADYQLQFKITPKVLQGGTFRGVDYTNTSSIFRLYNGDRGQVNENLDVYINYDYTVEETDDFITVILKGIKSFRMTVTPVRQGIQFPVHDKLYRDNNVYFDIQYTSGVGYSYDSGEKTGFSTDEIIFKIDKSKGQQASENINKKLVRFDDIGVIASGNNYIELWLDAIIYIPPPKFKPWASRNKGIFKSHERHNGWFKIRKNGSWADVSLMENNEKRQANKGNHRIRHGNTWQGQDIIGQ